jgi:hypothetical protein
VHVDSGHREKWMYSSIHDIFFRTIMLLSLCDPDYFPCEIMVKRQWKESTTARSMHNKRTSFFAMVMHCNMEMIKINQTIITHYMLDNDMRLSTVLHLGKFSFILRYIKASYGRDNWWDCFSQSKLWKNAKRSHHGTCVNTSLCM